MNEFVTPTHADAEMNTGANAPLPNHAQLGEGLAELRQSMEAAGQADNVTFLEMSRWRSALRGLEQSVVALAARDEDRQLMLAHALHDIRGTVGVVRGYSELVLRTRDTGDRTRRMVHRILNNADTLNGLLEEILTLLRCDAGKMRVNASRVNVREEVALVAEGYEIACQRKDLAFRCSFVEPMPAQVSVDVLILRRILGNVLENAVKFTEAGTVSLEVSHESSQLIFRVADTGPGIAAEIVPALFEPYQQRHGSDAPGTGLGLSVVRRLSRALGGDVVLEFSSPDSGSVFRISVIAESECPPSAGVSEEKCRRP